MDLSSLKDMDVKDLLSKLKGSQAIFSDKKMLTKFGIIFGAIVIFLIIYYVYFNPMIQKQKQQIEIMKDKEKKTSTMIEDEVNLVVQIKNLEPEFNEQTSLFHTKEEFEDFMMTMDSIAEDYGLNAEEIIRGKKVPVYKQNVDDGSTEAQSTPPLYYSLPVTWKITGTYLNYLKYRKEISKTKKHIYFHKETITQQANARAGEILAEGKISIIQLSD